MSPIALSSLLRHRFMEDNEATDNETGVQPSLAADGVAIDGDEGKWILFSIAILMSWCFLAVAIAMGYYSWREDRLLKKYQIEGVVISGQVSNIVLLREGSRERVLKKKKSKNLKTIGEEKGDGDTASLSDSDERQESVRSDVPYSESNTYLVAIKYDVELSPGYTTGVIKWVRLEGDVLPRSLFYRKKSSLVGMTVLFNLVQTPTQQERSVPDTDADTSLPLVILDSLPLSAHPQYSIVKSRSISSRSVTLSIVAFFAIAGAITHCLAVHVACAANLEDGLASFHILSTSAILSLLCIILALLSIAIRIMDGPVSNMLEKEYTKRGEFSAVGSGQTNDFTVDTLEMGEIVYA